jgi:hypothetical protein
MKYLRTIRITWIAGLCSFMLFHPSIGLAQIPAQQSIEAPPEPSPELYQQVMASAFPPPPELGPDVVFDMSVLIRQAFGGMAQINITLYLSKGPQVEYFVTRKKVSEALGEVMKAGEDVSVPSIVKRLVVDRKSVKVEAAQIFEWQKGLFKTWAATLPTLSEPAIRTYERRPVSLLLDADIYEIRYSQYGAKMHGTFFGSRSEGPAIATWAEEVRAEVVKRTQ